MKRLNFFAKQVREIDIKGYNVIVKKKISIKVNIAKRKSHPLAVENVFEKCPFVEGLKTLHYGYIR